MEEQDGDSTLPPELSIIALLPALSFWETVGLIFSDWGVHFSSPLFDL